MNWQRRVARFFTWWDIFDVVFVLAAVLYAIFSGLFTQH